MATSFWKASGQVAVEAKLRAEASGSPPKAYYRGWISDLGATVAQETSSGASGGSAA